VIRTEWSRIVAKARVAADIEAYLPAEPNLFGSSHKVDLGGSMGVATKVIYLPPANALFGRGETGDRRTLCSDASDGCIATCLGENTGLLITSSSERARMWKGALYMGDRGLFRRLCVAEAMNHVDACRASGKVPALRCDGSSDTAEGRHLAAAVPDAMVYDYTKNERKALRFCRGEMPPNYHVTFSYSGDNLASCERVWAAGGNVAVAFDTPKGEALPATWQGVPVIDGDVHDARFLDPQRAGGYVVGLRFKAARNRQTGIDAGGTFVVHVETEGDRIAA
jgi:hypothetical protein